MSGFQMNGPDQTGETRAHRRANQLMRQRKLRAQDKAGFIRGWLIVDRRLRK